jgi:hypothetical protein
LKGNVCVEKYQAREREKEVTEVLREEKSRQNIYPFLFLLLSSALIIFMIVIG